MSRTSCQNSPVDMTHSHAAQNMLKYKHTSFRLDVVGSKGKHQEGLLYKLSLVHNLGVEKRTLGLWVDNIMETPKSRDLLPVRCLFPYVPGAMFETAPRRPVDMLVGNNFLDLLVGVKVMTQ